MDLDWTPIITAGLGLAAGFAGGWFTRPAAQRKADEESLKQQQRRKVLADARDMIAEATQMNLPKGALANDSRLLAVRSQLDEEVLAPYKHNPMAKYSRVVRIGTEDHGPLLKNLDRLEKKWKLV